MRLSLVLLTLLINGIVKGQNTPSTTLPFQLENNSIYVYIKVNEADSLKFLFDTGANGSVINERSLSKVKLVVDGESLNIGSNGSNIVKLSSDNSIMIGAEKIQHIALTIIPYETDAFDGVLGTNIMEKFTIEIDYNKSQLRLFQPDSYKINKTGYKRAKLYFPGEYFSIKGAIMIDGKKHHGYFGLDTGADNVLTLTSPFVQKNGLTKKLQVIGTSTSQGSDGSVYQSPIVDVDEVEFGDRKFYSIPTDLSLSIEGGDAVNDKIGFYGNAFLKKFDTIIDFKNKSIYFKPNHNLYIPFYQ